MRTWALLVEDNPDDQELLVQTWQRLNLRATLETCRDGVEAMARLQRDPRAGAGPVVVLLDLKMPRMSGFEVLSELRASEPRSSVPIVVLTSSGEPSDVRRCYALGANGFVVKPVDVRHYQTVIATLARYWTDVNEPLPPESHDAHPADPVRRGPS